MTGEKERWGIIGGGMLGLTLAHRLAQQGKNVTLIEAEADLGGLASAWKLGGVVWDRHYHVTLLSDSFFRSILAELDLDDQIEWVTTKTGCFADGKIYSVSNSLEFLRFPPLRLIDKVRLAATIWYGSRISNWKKLEQVTVSDWLTRCSGKRTFERFWLPLLRSKLGENYKATSAAFIWTTIQRLYAARRSGLKEEMFGYVPGGYARILDRFRETIEAEGIRIELGKPVAGIERRGKKLNVEYVQGEPEEYDKVVVTAAAPLAAKICSGLSEEEYRRLNGVRYQGIVCASLLLRNSLSGFYVTNLLDDGIPFTGVIETSAMVDRRHFNGNALVYLPKYVPIDDPFFRVPDEEVEDLFLSGLERIHDGFSREDVLAFRVSRVRYVCPLSTLGYSSNVPEMRSSVPGLYIVNSSQILNGTLNVNETVQLAERAAKMIGNEVGECKGTSVAGGS